MSYTVLARKFRSQTFDEVVGQESVVQTLRNAISQGRVHHGYLFTGTRGVGKTSMARILAKNLNCLTAEGPTVTPCGTCDSCENIARGEDVDVVEIDAASHTGVENIRELRSNTVYRPARSRFKIYIIDEVHMLSAGAFNALLKTLEEPPSHVKFILATTEVQKVPATILSRVQRFDFRPIAPADIAAQLKHICDAEGVTVEDAALRRLARLANGSMRDALSLLDQALSMTTGSLTAEGLAELFPAAHDELAAELIDKLADGDAAGALNVLDRSLSGGQALDTWCSMLIGQLRDLMIVRVCGPETDLADVPQVLSERIAKQSARFDAGAFVYMITVLEELRRSVKSSGSGRALVEAAVVRLCDAAKFSTIESLLERAEAAAGGNASSSASPPRAASAAPTSTRPAPAVPSAGSSAVAPRTAPSARPTPTSKPTSKPTAAAPQPVAPPRRLTQAELRAAQSDPTVRSALELFGGQVVDVKQAPVVEAADGEQTAQEP